ncbi:CD1375 family protein [Paenibacillus sp. FSL L8-0340]
MLVNDTSICKLDPQGLKKLEQVPAVIREGVAELLGDNA